MSLVARRHCLTAGSLASVFRRLEELVLANSGADDFEEIFKLLVAKLWDERQGGARLRTRAPMLLAEAARAWPTLFDEEAALFRLAPSHLAVCAGVMAEAELGHSGEALDALFEFLTSRVAKGKKGQFFTPRHVVDFCVRRVRPRRGETVLDPACGSGAFLLAAYQRRAAVLGWDFDGRATRVAKTLLLVAGEERPCIERRNSLARDTGEPRFDVVLTNPPFAGEIRERALLDGYRFGRRRARVERDVLFLERAVELLRPGGRLAIVLPHGKLAARAHAPLRRWLLEQVRVVGVVGLGRNTFLPHTSQKTSVLFARKRERPGARSKNGREPIFFAVSERDGKTTTGEPILREDGRVEHDLDEIAVAFDRFEREHGGLQDRSAG